RAPARQEAERMLSAFASVGAARFDLTLITLAGQKAGFQRGLTLPDLTARLDLLLEAADRHQHNVIVRPHTPPPVFLLQLDDLKEASLERIREQAFLCVKTSPANFQAWVALPNRDEALIRGLRQTLSADLMASGAVRLAGSRNFKARYAPEFPR